MSEEIATPVETQPPGLWTRACQGEMDCLATFVPQFWLPVYAWLRSVGDSAEAAPRHCGDFLSHIAASRPPAGDDISAARLREHVLGKLREFLASGFPASPSPVAVDGEKGEQLIANADGKTEDDIFHQRWALRLLEMAIIALRSEYEAQQKAALFTAMKPFLSFSPDEKGYSSVAKDLGMSGSAFHMQVFAFRKRYRALLRGLIADTVRHPDDVDSELTALLVAAS